jgi:transposase
MANKTIQLDKDKIATLYESGNSTEQISKVFGVTPPTIRKFMRKHDIKLRNSRRILTEEQIAQAAIMHSSGQTLKQIATTFNVGYTCIHKSLKTGEKKKKKNKPPEMIIDRDDIGYNPTQFKRKLTQTNEELNLYIPEKWKR